MPSAAWPRWKMAGWRSRNSRQGQSGQLTIGAGVTTSIFVLPGVAARLSRRYPALEVIIRTGRSREIVELLQRGEVDLGTDYHSLRAAAPHPAAALRGRHHPGGSAGPSVCRPDDPIRALARACSHPLPAGQWFSRLSRPGAGASWHSVDNQVWKPIVLRRSNGLSKPVSVSLSSRTRRCRRSFPVVRWRRVQLRDLAPLRRTTYLAYLANRYQTFGMRAFIDLLGAHASSRARQQDVGGTFVGGEKPAP